MGAGALRGDPGGLSRPRLCRRGRGGGEGGGPLKRPADPGSGSALPTTAFIDPRGGNRGEIEELAHRFLALGLDHAARAGQRSPLPAAGEAPPVRLPEDPVPEDRIVDGLRPLLDGAMNPAHPGYMGHMDPLPATLSVLGDLLASVVNNNLLSVEMSPTLTRLETELLGDLARRFGLGDGAGGVLASGGTLANLHALTVARNRAAGGPDAGLAGAAPPAFFASDQAHVSLRKASMVLGLGGGGLVEVRTDAADRMDVAHLASEIRRVRRGGGRPFAVVATAGTTITGAVDPLAEVARVAREEALWLHVDAAYGGALVFSERHRSRLRGIEKADSVCFNPQKWCYVAKTCAMALFRDFEAMGRDFRVAAPYMKDRRDLPNLGELSLQGTRRADALKLWLVLQHLGRSGIAGLVDASCRLAGTLEARLRGLEGYEVAVEPETNLVCLRGTPAGTPEEQDAWNAELQSDLLERGGMFVSLPVYRGRRWLRLVLLNPYTGEREIERLLGHLASYRAAGGPPPPGRPAGTRPETPDPGD